MDDCIVNGLSHIPLIRTGVRTGLAHQKPQPGGVKFIFLEWGSGKSSRIPVLYGARRFFAGLVLIEKVLLWWMICWYWDMAGFSMDGDLYSLVQQDCFC